MVFMGTCRVQKDGEKRIWVNVLKESRRKELEAAGLIRS